MNNFIRKIRTSLRVDIKQFEKHKSFDHRPNIMMNCPNNKWFLIWFLLTNQYKKYKETKINITYERVLDEYKIVDGFGTKEFFWQIDRNNEKMKNW